MKTKLIFHSHDAFSASVRAAAFASALVIVAVTAVAQSSEAPPMSSASSGPMDSYARNDAPSEYSTDPESPWYRAREARVLAAQGKPGEALKHLLWCYDYGAARYPDYLFALRGQLPAQIAVLGQSYPPALEALKERAQQLRAQLAAKPAKANADVAAQLAAADVALQDKPAVLETLKMLPKGRAAQAYGEIVRPVLIANRYYREAVDIGSPEKEFGRRRAEMQDRIDEVRQYSRADITKAVPAMYEAAAMAGVLYVEALAGVGETARAQKLMRDVLKVQDSPAVRNALDQALRRAGAVALADELPTMKK